MKPLTVSALDGAPKPHYRRIAGNWLRVESKGKPHLRLTLTGHAWMVRPAEFDATQSADEYAAAIRSHYGSITAFAARWGFTLAAVINALSASDGLAGQARAVRLFLGLRSKPTRQGQVQAISKALARGRA